MMTCCPLLRNLLLAGICCCLLGADSTRFRGDDGSGISDSPDLPAEWSSEKNVVWKAELPGPGTSSPLVLKDRIYITSYSGYALSQEDPGDQKQLQRHLICLDQKTGKVLWSKNFAPKLPESEHGSGTSGLHGYASSTPASDGQRLYVFFGKSGVYCLDLDGNEVWHAGVGDGTHKWGSANSPVLYKDLVIINASVESQSLIALNKGTGEEVWKVDGIRGARNTPLLVQPAGSSEMELVVSTPGGPGSLVAYAPQTGKELWTCDAIPDRGYVCPSVIAHEGIVYAIGGRSNTALAVRAGGRGDVTDSHRLWITNKGSNVASPVYHEGHLYWVHESRGTAYCLDAKTGKVVYEKRLEPRPGRVYASALLADGKLFYPSRYDGTFVLAAKPEFELMAHNAFAGEGRCNACPVACDQGLLLRHGSLLYCIGNTAK